MFSEEEILYLKSTPLGRIATVSNDSQPDVAPVGFSFDGELFLIGGRDITKTLKFKNVEAGNHLVAFVVDDLESIDPWRPRGIKIHASAEILPPDESQGTGPFLRLTPTVHWSWGIEGPVWVDGRFSSKKVVR